MSAKNLNTENRLKHEIKFLKFLSRRIYKLGGSIKLQSITGSFSQVSPAVQRTIGTSEYNILKFIEKYKDTFNFDKGIITLVNNSVENNYENDIGNSETSLPKEILSGMGKIVKLLPVYGIIDMTHPIKESVFFSAEHFSISSENQVDLTNCNLSIGMMVNFNALRDKSKTNNTNYCATKVWVIENVKQDNNIVSKSRKLNETYSDKLEGEGVIIKLFPIFGFIFINGDENNCVYFDIKSIICYTGIYDLTKIFFEGDFVKFIARKTTNKHATAEWKAIEVWPNFKKKVSKFKDKTKTSKSESNIKNITSKSEATNKTIPSKSKSNIISNTQSFPESQASSTTTYVNRNIQETSTIREMIYNQSGKINLRSSGPVIKFGENLTQLAITDSSVYYINGSKVIEINWEFTDGDDVIFDAVKTKYVPGWKAVLVWIGDKPNIVLPTCADDFDAFTEGNEVIEVPPVSSLWESPHSLEKFASNKLEFSDYKGICTSSKTSEPGFHIQRATDSTNYQEIVKMSDLSSFLSHSLCSLPLPIESKISKNMEKEKLDRNKVTCGSLANLRNNNSESDMPTKLSYKYNSSTTISDNKLKSKSEYSSFAGENYNKTRQKKQYESIESFDKSDINKCKENSSEFKNTIVRKKASIKIFQDLVGEVINVYPIFAEVRNSKLLNPATFSGKVLYFEKQPMKDLKDLREVLKVGNIIHFNYFEITDDFAQTWNKVSLSWCGPKPSSSNNEITIKDFIQQNNLCVTVEEDSYDILTVQNQTVECCFSDYGSNECISQTESCLDVSDNCYDAFHSAELSHVVDEIKKFSDLISQELLMNGSFVESQVDFNSLSDEITNIVIEWIKGKEYSCNKLNSKLKEKCNSKNSVSENSAYVNKSEKCDKTENATNTEIQTISTTSQNVLNVILLLMAIFFMVKYLEN